MFFEKKQTILGVFTKSSQIATLCKFHITIPVFSIVLASNTSRYLLNAMFAVYMDTLFIL